MFTTDCENSGPTHSADAQATAHCATGSGHPRRECVPKQTCVRALAGPAASDGVFTKKMRAQHCESQHAVSQPEVKGSTTRAGWPDGLKRD